MKEAARCADRQGLVEQWISASEGYIQADVIRWTEGIYAKRRRKNAKSPRLGERQVTAEILEATDDGWLKLLVLGNVITKDDYAGSRLPPLNTGEQIKRARRTVERGAPERLLWSDERARSSVFASSRESTEAAPKPDAPPPRANKRSRKKRRFSPRRKG